MQVPLQVTFRDLPVSDAVEAACWAEAAKLERAFPRLTSCRVVIAVPHHRRRRGNRFDVRVDIGLPGAELAVSRAAPRRRGGEDVLEAVREAFALARRRLDDYVDRRRDQARASAG